MTMLRLSLRNLANNRLRFVLTTFSVLLGVSFVVASFVLTDGLLKTFDSIAVSSNADIDAQVRASRDFEEVEFDDLALDESIVDLVAAVEGVEVAEPGVESLKIVAVKPNGDSVDGVGGAPVLSFNWSESGLGPLSLVVGDVPDGPGEFAIDEGSADRQDMVVGQTYDIIGVDGREPFTLIGLSRFGEENTLAGAVIMSFTLDEIQRLDGTPGQVEWVDVSAPGVDPDILVQQLNDQLPANTSTVSGSVIVKEDQDDFSDVVSIFGNILLAFALVAVFVSTFIIGNTFNILLGQRVRQLALLRALGATARQVRAGAVFEALIIGVVASIAGIGGGVLLAFALRALMNSLGFSLPSIELVLSLRTVIVAIVVGVGVTLLASLTPARRAAGVPPVAAMRAGYRFGSGEGTRRTIIAIVLSVIGVATLGFGLFGSSDNTALIMLALGAGAVFIFLAVSMFAPLFSSPSASLLGAPLEHTPGAKITGHMARENAARNNTRTASTAAGLMIGLALIAMASVVATSLKESFRAELGSTLIGDYLVTHESGIPFTNQLADEVAALPEFAEVSAVRYGNIRIAGEGKDVAATDLSVLTDLLDVDVLRGDPAASAGPGFVLLTQEAADENGVDVGDPLTLEFASTGEQTLTVGAVYDNEFLIGHYIIDLSGWEQHFDSLNDEVISAKLAPGVDEAAATSALAPLAAEFPQLDFETRSEFRERLEGQLDSLLIIINVFLALAIIIALLGITNTMALSVLERTQEIGLMRAIGMTRRQTRGMIRLEAAVVSLFGALLGVLVGLAFGWVAVLAIPDSFINRLAIPTTTLVMYVIIATITGLLAASLPARRAARLNILEAIAHV